MFRQAGVIQVDTLDAMFDVAQVLAYQPLPAGRRVAIVGNSTGLEVLAAEAAWSAGLTVVRVNSLGVTADAADFSAALTGVMADDEVDAVVVLFASVVRTDGADTAASLLAASRPGTKPMVATFLGVEGIPEMLRVDPAGVAGPGSLPCYRTPEGAVRALARAVDYASWLNNPQTALRVFADLDEQGARAMIAEIVRDHPDGVALSDAQTERLLACYGIRLLPSRPVTTVEEAIAAGEELGWQVVLRAADPAVRQRMDIAHVRLHVDSPEEMVEAWEELGFDIDDMASAGLVVQVMSAPGVPTEITCLEDLAVGPVISFAVALQNTDLLGDIAYRIPPLTESEVHAMVREIKTAKLFFNHRGSGWADVAALEDLVHRVSQLKDALPDVEYLQLGRVLVGTHGASVVRATVRVRPNPDSRSDWYTRRLTAGEDPVLDALRP
jgi:acyl-CoA synthetase (NDP forming)